jgi:hypothetical protein
MRHKYEDSRRLTKAADQALRSLPTYAVRNVMHRAQLHLSPSNGEEQATDQLKVESVEYDVQAK